MTDAREHLRELLDGWRREHGQQRLPIDVDGLASARGIRVERVGAGDWDGRAYVDDAGQVTVEVDARQPLVRQRFTVAHELVHTALPGFREQRRHRVDDDVELGLLAGSRAEEEQLCDWGASVLLMPDELTWSYRPDQGLRAVERLARDAKVSLEAAGLRLVERSSMPAAFVVADAVEEGLRVRYARVRDLGLLIPRGAQVAPTSALARAAATGGRERALEPLPGDSQRELHVEAKSYPTGRAAGTRERVLALAWPQGGGRGPGASHPAS
jgi:Zn-dependent peptidase ImmA (M78 family)